MQQIQQTVQQKSEAVQAWTSYGIGGGVAGTAWLVEIGDAAQALAFILGAVVVGIRALHDGLRFWRYFREGK